jgi:hypothetical protein
VAAEQKARSAAPFRLSVPVFLSLGRERNAFPGTQSRESRSCRGLARIPFRAFRPVPLER